MFSDNRELLSRSSTFKLLLYFLACIGVIYTVFVHQVYLSSDAFHRKQLDRELSQETEVFAALATQGKIDAIHTLIAEKQSISSPFTYHIQPVSTKTASLSYPAALTGNQPYFELSELKSGSSLLLDDHAVLRIEINRDLLQQYRDDLAPMMISGVALPVIVMIAGAVWFAVNIIQKLQRVNFAMNRVLCGEKSVKLAVSRNDDEFDLLSIHLNFMIEQIEKKENSLKALTVGIAHDLRTPMSRMKLRIESLLDDAHNPQIKEELEACHDDLELLLGMFNGMLEIANLNSGKQLVSKQPVDLVAVAQDAVDFLRPLAEEKLQQLTIRQDTPYQLDGEPNLLFRATINLIENAIKYTPEKGIITVVIDPFGVVVIDNGEGISDLDKSRVCEPMYRGDKSRTQSGYGLGLSLVDAVMKRHGGEVIFRDNSPGLRARLYFS
ncbi:sensor histidine kinase [Photobacterium sanguinicancri]|uniref:sensor histidine kinase n=1 Tax=Photobacterium sanguinicancri TaxID=875932 RepID=UPI0026E22C9B|nr:HAMP domain-containing sensor histidine kinase [Photobacterium sanguinicancri]MDO6496693.1 HAMP domain-containing sensor histidine kinase [Photobacterium sanguinicancri]